MLSSGPGAVSRVGAVTSSSALPKKRKAGVSAACLSSIFGWGCVGWAGGVSFGGAGGTGWAGAGFVCGSGVFSSAKTRPVSGAGASFFTGSAGEVGSAGAAGAAGAALGAGFGVPKSMAFSSFISSSSFCSMAVRGRGAADPAARSSGFFSGAGAGVVGFAGAAGAAGFADFVGSAGFSGARGISSSSSSKGSSSSSAWRASSSPASGSSTLPSSRISPVGGRASGFSASGSAGVSAGSSLRRNSPPNSPFRGAFSAASSLRLMASGTCATLVLKKVRNFWASSSSCVSSFWRLSSFGILVPP